MKQYTNKVCKILWVTLLAITLANCTASKDMSKKRTVKKKTEKEIVDDIFKAILEKDTQALDLLIEKKVNLNIYDSEGYTPLMRAVKLKDSNLVEKLIKAGAKIYGSHKSHIGLTAVDMINDNEKEIKRIFDNEIKKYGEAVEEFIIDKEYEKALRFSQKNRLPNNLMMPKSRKTALQLIAHAYPYRNYLDEEKISDKYFIAYINWLLSPIPQSLTYLVLIHE